ncbi:MAG: glycerol-3-phosphate dehydrogenase/oxidase [Anaerolineaceae bacterium]
MDILIVGGGINGAGAFLDMAVNGLRVLLIDRGDFCSGASATSSHMAHGGIRYLENGEFRLVREAVAERNRMIRNAPHMVKPLPTVIPMFKLFSGFLNAPLKFLNLLDKPSERGAAVIKIGLILYDSFTGKNRTVPAHQFFGKKETFKRYPRLNKDVRYTAEYYDGLMLSPERLNTEIILDAEKAGEAAMALNYASFDSVDGDTVLLNDYVGEQILRVKPKMIVNAAGPWIDDVNNRMGKQTNYIGGTKGSHIIVKNPELKKAIGNKEFFFENKDGRIVLLLPFFDKVIIGTSDLPIDDPDGAVCTPEEEAYFIDLVKRVFPEIPILPEQIVFRFSGVRPLEYQHAKTTGQITRDHTIKEDLLGNIPVLNLIGGKWTSYRAFGEQTGDKALDYLSQHRKGTTEEMKIGGGRDYPPTDLAIQAYLDVFSTKGFEKGIVETLFERYGSTINEIIGTGTIEFLKSNPLITVNEINFLARTEKVVHLDDLLLRRTSLGWLGLIDEDCLREISMLVGAVLGWSTDKKQNEIERVKALFLKNHGVTI